MEDERPASRAAKKLSADLHAAGIKVSPRQIERWRQAGLIEATDRSWIPCEGSEAEYGPQAFEQARGVKHLVDDGLTLEQIAVVQFVRRRYVTTSALKHAIHQQLIETLGPGINAKYWTEAEPIAEERAAHIARRLARESEAKSLRQQLHRLGRQAGERINQAVARVIAGALMPYLAGEPRTRRELTALLKALGLSIEHLSMDEIVANLRLLRIEALSQELQVASRDELEQARDDYVAISQWAARIGYRILAPPSDEYRIAIRLLAMLTLRKRFGSKTMNQALAALTSSKMN